MIRTIWLTSAAMGLVAIGMSAGLAARPTAPDAQPAADTDKVAAAHAERVSKLAELTVYMSDREKAGIARMQDVLMLRVALFQAKAEAATTDAERLAMLKQALEALQSAEAADKRLMEAGQTPPPGLSPSEYAIRATAVINQTAEIKIAIAKLEAAASRKI